MHILLLVYMRKLLYCSFFIAFFASETNEDCWMKNARSIALRTSSMSLGRTLAYNPRIKGERSETYITGALIMSTAFHSNQFRGKIENRLWRTGM
jgi:hypothetical protein